jgi:4,5-dihydroxyphthalate decarboxylase
MRPVTVAVTRDYDRTAAIAAGEFTAGGRPIDLRVEQLEHVFAGMGREQLWDAAEMSFSFYLSMLGASGGNCPIVALPVFLSRMFRYGNLFVQAADPPTDPRELGSARIGVPEFGSTMSLWLRGILSDEYGVDWANAEWVPARHPLVTENTPTVGGPDIMGVRDQFAALARGELGAIFGSLERRISPESIGVRHLFADYYERDRDFFRKTGIFPIMHVVAVRRALLDEEPDVVRDLYQAFCAAKDRALARLAAAGPLPVLLPFLAHYLEDQTALMGSDPWPYGVDTSRPTIEAGLRYSFEQGLSPRLLTMTEVFPNIW